MFIFKTNQIFKGEKCDLARIFKVHKNTVFAWVTRREIPFVKLPGNTTRFPRKKVESWLQKRLACGKSLGKGVYLE